MTLSPIILTIYNRPKHTKKTLDALKANTLAKDSILYIYADGYKGEEDKEEVLNTRKVVKDVKGFKEVHIVERDKNIGLANSIISSVTEVINKHGKVILLEDDLVTSPVFLEYMNNMLDKYEKQKKVFSITGFGYPKSLMKIPPDYNYDIYFAPRAGSWGWATWKDRWEKADWDVKDFEEFKKNKNMQKEFNRGGDDMSDMLIRQMEGKIDSWAIRWCYTLFKNNAYCIYPVKSYIDNIGNDGSGVHCRSNDRYDQKEELSKNIQLRVPPMVEIDNEIERSFNKMFCSPLLKRIAKKFKR
jgi:hypothetical protein